MTAHDRRLTLSHSRGSVALGGLWQWVESGSIESALTAMAKKIDLPHWGSKGAVNRAGEALRNGKLGDGQADVLESWRMAHRDVINTFQAMLRARAKNMDVEVAQRLKRRSTIIDKLSRHSGMQLARMDDVAGCRLIFPDIKALHDFRAKLHKANVKHILKNEKDKYNYIGAIAASTISMNTGLRRGIQNVMAFLLRFNTAQISSMRGQQPLRL